jgi:hypothetical protein
MAVLSIPSKRNMAAFLLLLALPSAAQANTGTPLMWAGLFHLMVAVTYVLTLILEFPFVAFAFRHDPPADGQGASPTGGQSDLRV